MSKHSTFTRPSASMVRGLRTSAPRAARRRAAASCAAVTRKGNPSGTDATARPTAAPMLSLAGRPRSSPAATTAPADPRAIGSVVRVIWASLASTPVTGAAPDNAARALPVSVALPVSTTTAVARPAATVLPSYSIELRPAIASAVTGSVALSTGNDSPVSDDSSISSARASSSRQSAGTTSPAPSRMTSPTTNPTAGMVRSRPSRRTRAVTAEASSSRAIDRSV